MPSAATRPRRTFLRGLGATAVVGVAAGCESARAHAPPAPKTAPERPTTPAEEERTAETASPLEVPRSRGVIVLMVLGKFRPDLIDAVEQILTTQLRVSVVRRTPTPLPKSAFYSPRRRYRADRLLEHLLTFIEDEPQSTRILGLTHKDISTTKGKHHDWGIFGLGYRPGRAAVVSSFRLGRKAKDRKHLQFRVANTALHEAGHMFGLPHCSEPGCPMRDAEGSISSTDDSDGHLGPGCQAKLDAAVAAMTGLD